MSDDDWFAGALGPGWNLVDEGPASTTYRRHTELPDGSHNDETATVYPGGLSLFIKTHVVSSTDPSRPTTIDVDDETTYTRHDSDGTVLGVSSTNTTTYVDGRGRTWFTTITDERGDVTTQRGVTYDGPHGGSETVTSDRSNGTTRVDNVSWVGPSSEGTRLTTEKDADGNVISTLSDDVIRDDNGNWTYKSNDTDDDDDVDAGDNPAVISGGEGDGGGVEEGPIGAEGGDFGPGGPDTGAASVGDGDGGDDGDDEGEDGEGDGDEPHIPGPVINPPVV